MDKACEAGSWCAAAAHLPSLGRDLEVSVLTQPVIAPALDRGVILHGVEEELWPLDVDALLAILRRLCSACLQLCYTKLTGFFRPEKIFESSCNYNSDDILCI